MARSSECTERYAHKVFDSADIVREGCYSHGGESPASQSYSDPRWESGHLLDAITLVMLRLPWRRSHTCRHETVLVWSQTLPFFWLQAGGDLGRVVGGCGVVRRERWYISDAAGG